MMIRNILLHKQAVQQYKQLNIKRRLSFLLLGDGKKIAWYIKK